MYTVLPFDHFLCGSTGKKNLYTIIFMTLPVVSRMFVIKESLDQRDAFKEQNVHFLFLLKPDFHIKSPCSYIYELSSDISANHTWLVFYVICVQPVWSLFHTDSFAQQRLKNHPQTSDFQGFPRDFKKPSQLFGLTSTHMLLDLTFDPQLLLAFCTAEHQKLKISSEKPVLGELKESGFQAEFVTLCSRLQFKVDSPPGVLPELVTSDLWSIRGRKLSFNWLRGCHTTSLLKKGGLLLENHCLLEGFDPSESKNAKNRK